MDFVTLCVLFFLSLDVLAVVRRGEEGGGEGRGEGGGKTVDDDQPGGGRVFFVRLSWSHGSKICPTVSSSPFSLFSLHILTCIAIIHSGQLAPKTPMRSLGEMPVATRAEPAASTRAATSSYVIHS